MIWEMWFWCRAETQRIEEVSWQYSIGLVDFALTVIRRATYINKGYSSWQFQHCISVITNIAGALILSTCYKKLIFFLWSKSLTIPEHERYLNPKYKPRIKCWLGDCQHCLNWHKLSVFQDLISPNHSLPFQTDSN